MKRSLLLLIISSGILFAQNSKNIDTKKNMQEMEVSMAVIQRGFLYNDATLVKGGIKSLQSMIKEVEPPTKADEVLLGKGNTYSFKYAKQQSQKITQLSEELLSYYDKNEKYAAMGSYKEILRQCLACHKKIRRW